MKLFTQRNKSKVSDFETWAKIEFKNDWVYAYNHMLETGDAPKKGN